MSEAEEFWEAECKEGDEYLVNPRNPSTFYQCQDGVPHELPCPPGMILDPSKSTCTFPQDVKKYWFDRVEVPGH